jgi:hypothetical protein
VTRTPDDLASRLEQHAERLEREKSLPWLGLGLHRDLKAAVAQLRGQPAPPALEFDL